MQTFLLIYLIVASVACLITLVMLVLPPILKLLKRKAKDEDASEVKILISEEPENKSVLTENTAEREIISKQESEYKIESLPTVEIIPEPESIPEIEVEEESEPIDVLKIIPEPEPLPKIVVAEEFDAVGNAEITDEIKSVSLKKSDEVEAAPSNVQDKYITEPKENVSEISAVRVAPVSDSENDEIGIAVPVLGDAVQVRYRSSFMSRLIQSESEIQDYYTAVKNALLSYKGVKARTSWGFESFNKGRVQCAKLNIKGKNFLVNLALNPNEYNQSKYYFTDVSSKPGLDKVPFMLKVKSERGLKHALELIKVMMEQLGIQEAEKQILDYRMPYETTEALVEKGLIKVILPPGVTLDENSSVTKANVGEIIDKANEISERSAKTAPEVVSVSLNDDVESKFDSEIVNKIEAIEENDAKPETVTEQDELIEENEPIPESVETDIVIDKGVVGIPVVDIVWQEHVGKNKTYRYSPNGFELSVGDAVLVPTFDAHKNGEIARKATVCSDVYSIDPSVLKFRLKAVLRVLDKNS